MKQKEQGERQVMVEVVVMSREMCGSCKRVIEQIRPVVAELGAQLRVVDVDSGDGSAAMEFGDRVPVVLVDDDEIACWEIDNENLVAAIEDAQGV